MSSHNTTEEFFLKIFKSVILAIMSIALIVTIGSLIYSAFEYLQTPKEPAPAKTAPAETVNLDDFINQIKPQPKKAEESPKSDEEQTPEEQPKQEKPSVKKYLTESQQILICAAKFDAKTNNMNAYNIEVLLNYLARNADSTRFDRGQPWVTDLAKFECSVFANAQIIELKKKNSDLNILDASIYYHIRAWDEIKKRVAQFNKDEEDRINSERAEEESRVFAAKAKALGVLIVAASAFGVFMLLALYLIISAIESNLRRLSDNVEEYKKITTAHLTHPDELHIFSNEIHQE